MIRIHPALTIGLALGLACSGRIALAQEGGDTAYAALRGELAALREQQARIAALGRDTENRIRHLAQRLGVDAPSAPAAAEPSLLASQQTVATTAAPAGGSIATLSPPAPRLTLSSDLRLRHERNFSEGEGPARNRGAVRARIGAEYTLQPSLAVGARLVTGDLDDPRSTGATLSHFNNDFDVGLDRLYLRYTQGGATLWGGRFANPFRSSSLVWDGDVNPQGAAIDWRSSRAGGVGFHATALYFAIDEQSAGQDSHMLGGQLGLESGAGGSWRFEAHAGYYHYMLDSVGETARADFRTNLRDADGDYLSRFHLANLIAGVTYGGFGKSLPLQLTGEYVRNLGAATGADSGYGVEATLGRTRDTGDWRLRYGYQAAQTDAVLAAFSHDDTTLATNYRQHALALDYVLRPDTTFNFTWYRFRPDDPDDTPAFLADRWLHRLRLNLLFRF